MLQSPSPASLFYFSYSCSRCALITAESTAAKQYSVYLTSPLRLGATVGDCKEERRLRISSSSKSSAAQRNEKKICTTAHPDFVQLLQSTDSCHFICGSRRNRETLNFLPLSLDQLLLSHREAKAKFTCRIFFIFSD